jgi:Protein of unknown function (DUF1549)/Protein of unknown function (DUF1553)
VISVAPRHSRFDLRPVADGSLFDPDAGPHPTCRSALPDSSTAVNFQKIRFREKSSMRHRCALAIILSILPAPASAAEARPSPSTPSALPAPASLTVTPAEIKLRGVDAVQHLLVTGPAHSGVDGWFHDYSRAASFASSDPRVAVVSADGVVSPRGDGEAEIRVGLGGVAATARVSVSDFGVESRVSFGNQILPILTKAGCNAGGCHGKASGQNGFKLSLLGFDPRFDFDAIVKEGRGRRLFPAHPEQSLLLRKSTGEMPHGGGRRVERDSMEYALLLRWVLQGSPPGSKDDPSVVSIECTPRRSIVDRHAEQQVIVTATYSDGGRRDVTREVQFKSNEPEIAQVDARGLVRTDRSTGETAIMARYMGRVDVCRVTIPLPASPASIEGPDLPRRNYVDDHVQARWKALNLTPSPLADDPTFLRRAYLDAIGTLPTVQEVRAFLDDPSPNKRAEWIDKLLSRGEYADFWAVKWGDLLRNQRKGQRDHQRGTYAFHAWIRNALATNMPYDRFVRSIVAAQGTVDQHPPVIWYRTVRNPTHQTNDTAQLFLGTRINCAQCHNHPYEKWSQEDYYRFQAFFARMGRKSGETAQEPAIFVKPDGAVRHPITGQVMAARGLDGPELRIDEDEDPRQKLVDWMADPKNPFFARALVNRIWGHFLGRGLVEPIDDMRVTNPPSNPELLDALARDFIDHRFDVKHLIRAIMNSTAYQLSSEPTPGNIQDRQNYARAYPKRLLAEVMLDAIGQATGSAEAFAGMPRGTKTIQLPDESIPSYFLEIFGRPQRETACECERPREANLAQALQLLNSTDLQGKIAAPQGRLAALLDAKADDGSVIEDLYLATLARRPRASESETIRKYLAARDDRKSAFEDLIWAMLNTKEFLFNH